MTEHQTRDAPAAEPHDSEARPGAADVAVSVRDVSVTYGNGTKALLPLSLEFRNSDLTVLLGRSGAGKSSLLRVINHLVTPSTGTIAVDGIGELSSPAALRRHRRQTAMIFQQHQLIPRLSALHNTVMGRLGHYPAWRTLLPFSDADLRLAQAALERVGLGDRALQRCDNLSGGQQQRVGIARAFAQEPKLILADEPVASLDPATSARVLTLLRDLCREESMPAIVSLHQVELARDFADRIVALSHGAVVFDGRPGDLTPDVLQAIYEDPSDPSGKGEESEKMAA